MSDSRDWHVGLISFSTDYHYITTTRNSKTTINSMDVIVRTIRSNVLNGYPARSELARYLHANPMVMKKRTYSITILGTFDNSADADCYANQMRAEAMAHNADLLNINDRSEDRVR